jgi:hypothetical protein
VACPGAGGKLVVRRVVWEDQRGWNVLTHKADLPARVTLAGVPALVGDWLMMPLSDGVLYRLRLNGTKAPEGGPNWRGSRQLAEARGQVVWLGGDRFLISNGGRGLQVWEWPSNRAEASGPEEGRLELPDRLVGSLLVLPGPAGRARDVVAADSGGVVRLLRAGPGSKLSLRDDRMWDLKGRITAGPFLLSGPGEEARVGVVVEQTRLVALDPARDGECWSYRTGGAALVGQPERFAGLLAVGDLSGRVVGLDPETGRKAGSGCLLPGGTVPAGGLATIGPTGLLRPGALLVPLSDGTAVLLRPPDLR